MSVQLELKTYFAELDENRKLTFIPGMGPDANTPFVLQNWTSYSGMIDPSVGPNWGVTEIHSDDAANHLGHYRQALFATTNNDRARCRFIRHVFQTSGIVGPNQLSANNAFIGEVHDFSLIDHAMINNPAFFPTPGPGQKYTVIGYCWVNPGTTF